MSPRNKAASPEEALADTPLEKVLDRLAAVVEQLEKGDLPLEQALALYEEGVRMTREGQRRLDAAELRIEQILAAGADGNPVTAPVGG